MPEANAIEKSGPAPATVSSIARDARNLGLEKGMSVIVHSSLGAMGWVCGGPVAVILALEEVLTEEGSLAMPTHTSDLSDPALWKAPPVPESWVDPIRAEMPPFDPDLTPTREMGAVPEAFRKQRGVVRSVHPSLSFAAWGKHRDYIVQDGKMDYAMDDLSPLGRLYELDASILLIGVGHDKDTSLHLAEYRASWPGKRTIQEGYPSWENGSHAWKQRSEIDLYSDDFPDIGAAFEAERAFRKGKIAMADAKLIRLRDIVDFAVGWMERHRR